MFRRSFGGRQGNGPVGGAAAAVGEVSDAALPDRVVISRAPQGGTYDTLHHVYTPNGGTTIYAGPARVLPLARMSERQRQVVFGGTPIRLTGYVLTVPAAVDDVELGDQAVISRSDDESLQGRPLRVLLVRRASYNAARYLHVEDDQERT